jgi:hypothetical protein
MSKENLMKAFPNNRSEGMDLRDYFAAKAMQGLLANPKLQEQILKTGGASGGYCWCVCAAGKWASCGHCIRQ